MTDLVILVHGMAKSGRTKGALTEAQGSCWSVTPKEALLSSKSANCEDSGQMGLM